jgi:ferredoxin
MANDNPSGLKASRAGRNRPQAAGPYGHVEGSINGIAVSAPYGASLFDIAGQAGIAIPALCHHPGLPPDGNCRLCLVETKGALVASCLYPARENGFQVLTDSPRVKAARKFVLTLLLNRAPKSPALLALAKEYGAVKDPRFGGREDGCLRCGRCVRVCRQLGSEAISLVGRSQERKVSGPFFAPPDDCVGCLACARVCPTGVILFQETGQARQIWGREFLLERCPACQRPFATKEEISRARNQMASKLSERGFPESDTAQSQAMTSMTSMTSMCPECRSRSLARVWLETEGFLKH